MLEFLPRYPPKTYIVPPIRWETQFPSQPPSSSSSSDLHMPSKPTPLSFKNQKIFSIEKARHLQAHTIEFAHTQSKFVSVQHGSNLTSSGFCSLAPPPQSLRRHAPLPGSTTPLLRTRDAEFSTPWPPVGVLLQSHVNLTVTWRRSQQPPSCAEPPTSDAAVVAQR